MKAIAIVILMTISSLSFADQVTVESAKAAANEACFDGANADSSSASCMKALDALATAKKTAAATHQVASI